jgi:hypothetical protein
MHVRSRCKRSSSSVAAPYVIDRLGHRSTMDQDVVEISLPGFRMDQMRVQVDNQGVLRATGARTVRGGRWARFKKNLYPAGLVQSNLVAQSVRLLKN